MNFRIYFTKPEQIKLFISFLKDYVLTELVLTKTN